MKKSISILSACLIIVSQMVWVQASYAGIASTKMIVQSNEGVGQQTINDILNREQAKLILQAYGVDEKQLENRINKLTAEEITLINEKIGELPTGAGIGSTLILIGLIFVGLELLGVIDIFPGIQPLKNNPIE